MSKEELGLYVLKLSEEIYKLKKEKSEMQELLKKCWEIIPLDSKKWNSVFLEVDEFLKK